jgi:hypothetical protein
MCLDSHYHLVLYPMVNGLNDIDLNKIKWSSNNYSSIAELPLWKVGWSCSQCLITNVDFSHHGKLPVTNSWKR